MIAYATPNDCLDIVSSLTEILEKSDELETSLYQSLLDASRLFESDVVVPEDFFAPAGDTFEERTIYGDGTQFIKLRPFTAIEYVHDTDDEPFDVDEYIAYRPENHSASGYYLKWNYGFCGRSWTPTQLKVSAKWGFPCTPGDVVLAVKSMGSLMFLLNSNTRLGQNTTVPDLQETRLRNTYNRVVQAWQDKVHHWNLGIG